MTEAQKNKFKQLCYELDKAEAAKNLKSYDNMCDWLRKDHYSFYNQVKNNLYELWEEVKKIASDIFAIGVGIAVAPVIGIYEGIKAIGKWLDD